jgi:hypothetical protein
VRLFDDTHPDIEAKLIEGYRRMTPMERLQRAANSSAAVRMLAAIDVRRKHPGATEEEIRFLVATRIYGAVLMSRVPR